MDPFIVAAGTGGLAGAVATAILAPRIAWLQESARRDRVARAEIAKAVQTVKRAFEREAALKEYLDHGGRTEHAERLTPKSVHLLFWPIARALMDPDLNGVFGRASPRFFTGSLEPARCGTSRPVARKQKSEKAKQESPSLFSRG